MAEPEFVIVTTFKIFDLETKLKGLLGGKDRTAARKTKWRLRNSLPVKSSKSPAW